MSAVIRYNILKRESLLSWSFIRWALEGKKIPFDSVIDFAITKMEEPIDENIAVLAGLSESESDLLQSLVEKLAEAESVRLPEETWLFAALVEIFEASVSEQEKIDRLQEVYSEFNYSERLEKCSIYYTRPEQGKVNVGDILDDPLTEMERVIEQLRAEITTGRNATPRA